MKIRDVWGVIPTGTNEPRDWRTSMAQYVAVVETDDGVLGTGVGGGGPVALHIIDSVLRDVLVGRDPRDFEANWDAMYRATHHFGRKGLAVMALSGIDLALWDVLGKAENKPVYELLGGLKHDRVPAYASLGATVGDEVERGFRHIKLHMPNVKEHPNEIVQLVRAGREKIGPDVPLYLDPAARWTWSDCEYLFEALAPFDIGWIEEPLLADELDGHRSLRERFTIPVSGGEHEFTIWGYREILAKQAMDVWQPDASWVGGMTTMRQIFELGQANGIWVVPHRGSEVWGLHAIFGLSDRPLAETGRPWVTWVQGTPTVEDGWVAPPTGPGFGVTFDDALLARPSRGKPSRA
ncbi:MAG: mandelate racemase/muconate lactonizing enzyme family protein [Actinobacteria bacterium]|nr:mandelate racemase/muconate lactonizing enzyme family protein [Actinomycetota bacterium]